ncbi:ulp1 protease family, C-terminal catalytic domain-containing protein [Tanacetum coccineum]
MFGLLDGSHGRVSKSIPSDDEGIGVDGLVKHKKKSSKGNKVLQPKSSRNTKSSVKRISKEVVKPISASVKSNVGKRKRLIEDKDVEDERDSDVDGCDGENDSDKVDKGSEDAYVSNDSEEEVKDVKTKVVKGMKKVVLLKSKKQNEEVEADLECNESEEADESKDDNESEEVEEIEEDKESEVAEEVVKDVKTKVVKESEEDKESEVAEKVVKDVKTKVVKGKGTKVDFMFKVNFLMLFANVMGTADTMKAIVNLTVLRCIREDTNIAGIDWCGFIHKCLQGSSEPKTLKGFYLLYLDLTKFNQFPVIRQRPAIRNWTTTAMNQKTGVSRNKLLNVSRTRTSSMPPTDKKSFCSMIEEKISMISAEKIALEDLLKRANAEFQNDKKVIELYEKYRRLFKESVVLEDFHAHIDDFDNNDNDGGGKNDDLGSDNVGKKKESAAKDVGKKDGVNAEKDGVNVVQEGEADVNEEPEDMLEEVTFTQWIEKNIDWVGEPRAVQPITAVCPPQRVVTRSSPKKSIVKPPSYLNSPYMNKRTKVIPLIKRLEFVLGNSLFAMQGDKYEIVFQTRFGPDVSSVRVNMETLAPRLCIDANVIDCWVAILNHKEFVKAIINGTIDEEQQWKVFSDEISEQFKHDVSSISLSEVDLLLHPSAMIIRDNSDCGETYNSKYKAVCEPLKKFFVRHLKKYNHPKHNSISKLKHRIPKLKWSTTKNHSDCGVFTMMHLEHYFGKPAGQWDFGLCVESDEQVSMLRRMRFKILLNEFNTHAEKMFDLAFKFETENDEQKRIPIILNANIPSSLLNRNKHSSLSSGWVAQLDCWGISRGELGESSSGVGMGVEVGALGNGEQRGGVSLYSGECGCGGSGGWRR